MDLPGWSYSTHEGPETNSRGCLTKMDIANMRKKSEIVGNKTKSSKLCVNFKELIKALCRLFLSQESLFKTSLLIL